MTKTSKKRVEGYVRTTFDKRWVQEIGPARTVEMCVKYTAAQVAGVILEAQSTPQMDNGTVRWW